MNSPVIDYAGGAGDAGHAAFATMADIGQQTFGGFERLTRLNLQTMKTMLAEQHGIALEAADSRSLGWLLTLPSAQALACFKKTLAYWQHVNEITAETTIQNAGASLEGVRQCAQWLASSVSDAARTGAGQSRGRTNPETGLLVSSVETANDAKAWVAKVSGKKRSVDIVDGSGNVVSSVKP